MRNPLESLRLWFRDWLLKSSAEEAQRSAEHSARMAKWDADLAAFAPGDPLPDWAREAAPDWAALVDAASEPPGTLN